MNVTVSRSPILLQCIEIIYIRRVKYHTCIRTDKILKYFNIKKSDLFSSTKSTKIIYKDIWRKLWFVTLKYAQYFDYDVLNCRMRSNTSKQCNVGFPFNYNLFSFIRWVCVLQHVYVYHSLNKVFWKQTNFNQQKCLEKPAMHGQYHFVSKQLNVCKIIQVCKFVT